MLFMLSSSYLAHSQKITTFQKSFGGKQNDYGASVVELRDKGYILAGVTNSFGAGGYDILLIRTDSLGKKIWTKTYGGSNDEGIDSFYLIQSVDIILAQDTNIMVCSNTRSYGKGNADVYLLKVDLNGNVKWAKTYGGAGTDIGIGVINAPDGGFMIVGQTYSFGPGSGDVFIIKTDTGGNMVWAKAYGGASNEEAGYRIQSVSNGNYLICGYALTSNFSFDQMVMKIDSKGNLIWSKIYGAPSFDIAEKVVELPDKSIYVCGITYNSFISAPDVGIMSKLDSSGNLIWSKIYDKSYHSTLRNILYDSSNNVFNGSFFVYTNPSVQQEGIIRLDTSGGYIFDKVYGITPSNGGYSGGMGHDVLQLTSGGFVLIEYTNEFGFGNWDIFFLKTDSNANPTFCNVTTVPISPFLFTSYFANHSYPFLTVSLNPFTGNGVLVNNANVLDSIICSPFVTNFASKITCIGQTTPFFDSSYYEPTAWLWDFGDPSSASSDTSTLQNPTHVYGSPGTYTVKLVSGNGTVSDSIIHTITVLSKHSQLPTVTDSVCPGDSVNLSVLNAGSGKFSWSPGSSLNDSTDSAVWARPLENTTYVVTISNAAGCSVSDSFIVNMAHISIAPIGNKSSCSQAVTLSFGSYPNASHLWSTGDMGDSITVSQSGKYWLRINSQGCIATDSSVVTLLAPANFENDNLRNTLFCSDDSSLTLDAGLAYKYLWSPGGDTTQKIQVSATGSYSVQITASDGCVTSKTADITDQCTPYLFVPDVFTPNGNGLNDGFTAVSRYPLESYNMQIYNRWGERIFQSNDINIGWDGTFKGWDGIYKDPRCPEGVYLYVILYKFYYEVAQMKSGTVTLLR